MSHARYRPPDHSKGDESTIGGYMAVHDRPAAFEGGDGFSYSVEIIAEPTGEEPGIWGAFFLFVKWARLGAQTPEGHVESDYLAHADSEEDAVRLLGATPLGEVKALLDRLIAEKRGAASERRWWDAMRDEGSDA
ncbi:MAG TPA: hypothetical protein VIP11_26985 [Gemmatimonadaceae bacterium]